MGLQEISPYGFGRPIYRKPDFSRIDGVIDVEAMQRMKAVVIGIGGSANLCRNLVRCGLGRILLVDRDSVSIENICRQEHMIDQIPMWKTGALSKELLRINPSLGIATATDLCQESDMRINALCYDANILIAATDNHEAQAKVNRIALRLGKPAVFIGLYTNGAGGEVAFWHSGLASCYRCLVPSRYEHFAKGYPDPTTDGADIFALQLLDSVAGMIVLGLLTRGADNRYGRLIDQLGERNFLQVKIDPQWKLGDRDVVREELGIAADCPSYLSFCTIARKDPDPGGQCPDCKKYRRGVIPLPQSVVVSGS